MLLNSNKEHLLGLKMPYEKLRNKIADRVSSGEIKITDMTEIETIEFLTNNFYDN